MAQEKLGLLMGSLGKGEVQEPLLPGQYSEL